MKVKGYVAVTMRVKIDGEAEFTEQEMVGMMPDAIMARLFDGPIKEFAERIGHDMAGTVLDMTPVIEDIDCGDCPEQGVCTVKRRMRAEMN